AKLVVDPVFGAVLSHEAHVRPGPDVDLTKASSILEEQKRQREDKFADSFFQETHKEDILAKKFEEAMKKAKDAPASKPLRDFDLDKMWNMYSGRSPFLGKEKKHERPVLLGHFPFCLPGRMTDKKICPTLPDS